MRGFTLVEMLVVLGIISVITAIAVLGQSSFNKSILLTETSYGVAFSARQAQTFGISSRNFQQGAVSYQRAGYGLHFDIQTPDRYTLFADTSKACLGYAPTCPVGTTGLPDEKPGNCRFDQCGGGSDGIVSTYQFSRGFTITKFCVKSTAYGNYCTDTSSMRTLDVVFTRPNTTTTIVGDPSGASINFTCAEVTITDASGQSSKSIRFSSLGEIAIGQSCP